MYSPHHAIPIIKPALIISKLLTIDHLRHVHISLAILNTPMSFLTNRTLGSIASQISTSTFFSLPNLVMRWTMEYADRVSRRRREENIREMGDVEDGITTERAAEMLRALAGDDGNEDENEDQEGDVQVEEGSRARYKERKRTKLGRSDERKAEDWEFPTMILPARIPPQSLFQYHQQGVLGKSSKIEGIGLPRQGSHQSSPSRREVQRALPSTPEDLNALEAQNRQPSIPTRAPNSHGNSPHLDTLDQSYPPLSYLFADLPPSQHLILQDHDHSIDPYSPTFTIWNRGMTASPVQLSAPQTPEPPTDTSSVHSSLNGDPPADLLTSLSSDDDEPADPGVFVREAFAPILEFLKGEYNTTKGLKRYLRQRAVHDRRGLDSSRQRDRPPLSTSTPTAAQADTTTPTTTQAEQVAHHLLTLKKAHSLTKALAKHLVECTRNTAAFRYNIDSNYAVFQTMRDAKKGPEKEAEKETEKVRMASAGEDIVGGGEDRIHCLSGVVSLRTSSWRR